MEIKIRFTINDLSSDDVRTVCLDMGTIMTTNLSPWQYKILSKAILAGHDKNGEEVYEGDRVKWTDSNGEMAEFTEIVVFKDSSFYPLCFRPEFEFELVEL